MAHVFALYCGAAISQSLNTPPLITSIRYAIQSPTSQRIAPGQSSGDYGLSPSAWSDVTESIDILFDYRTSTLPLLQTAVGTIQRMLELGRQRQGTGMGDRLYLLAQLSGEVSVWRTEILSGRMVLDDAADQLQRLVVDATLIITRRYFWEYHATAGDLGPIVLSMTSSETTVAATTVTLYNNDDGTAAATNFIDIAAAQVTGSLPAPITLRINNDEASAREWRDFHIANTVFSDPANFDPFLLGSEADGGATFATALSTEELAFRWTLSDARLTDLAGRYFRLLLAFTTASTSTYFRAVVEAEVGASRITLYQGKLTLMAAENLIDIGAVPLPPGGFDLAGTNINVRINVLKAGGGTWVLDFLQLTPAGDGLYRKWIQLGFDTAQNAGIVDDGVENQLYWASGATHFPIIRGQAGPIFIWPGMQNRLRVLVRESGFVAGRRMTATISFRPRRVDV